MTAEISPLLTVNDVAVYLRRSGSWVYRHADALGAVRTGGPLLFEQADVDAYIRRHKRQTPEVRVVERLPRRSLPAPTAINPVTDRPFEVMQ